MEESKHIYVFLDQEGVRKKPTQITEMVGKFYADDEPKYGWYNWLLDRFAHYDTHDLEAIYDLVLTARPELQSIHLRALICLITAGYKVVHVPEDAKLVEDYLYSSKPLPTYTWRLRVIFEHKKSKYETSIDVYTTHPKWVDAFNTIEALADSKGYYTELDFKRTQADDDAAASFLDLL